MIFHARHPRGHEYLHGIQGRGVWISVCPDSIALEVREALVAPARLYCVAPLQLGPLPLVTYDFWLIGKECCQVRCRMQVKAVKGTTARHERLCHRQCFFIWLVMTWYDGMSFAAALHCFWEASKPGFNCGSAQHLHSSGLIASRQIWNVDVWPEVLQKSSVEMVPVFWNMSTYDISNLVLVWIIQLIRLWRLCNYVWFGGNRNPIKKVYGVFKMPVHLQHLQGFHERSGLLQVGSTAGTLKSAVARFFAENRWICFTSPGFLQSALI